MHLIPEEIRHAFSDPMASGNALMICVATVFCVTALVLLIVVLPISAWRQRSRHERTARRLDEFIARLAPIRNGFHTATRSNRFRFYADFDKVMTEAHLAGFTPQDLCVIDDEIQEARRGLLAAAESARAYYGPLDHEADPTPPAMARAPLDVLAALSRDHGGHDIADVVLNPTARATPPPFDPASIQRQSVMEAARLIENRVLAGDDESRRIEEEMVEIVEEETAAETA